MDSALDTPPSPDGTQVAGKAPKPANPVTVRQSGDLPPVLSNRYRIERLLGVGGMGAVYRARDLLREQYGDPDPYVALKTLNEEFAQYPDANALLYSEFALTSRLRHSNVIRFYAFNVDRTSQRAFMTMEMLKGPTLDQLISERRDGLDWPELQQIAVPLLEALHASHSIGVLHGDIKPSNVILTDDGLRLFDYGLGQPVQGLLPGLPRLSRKRIAAWTPRYAALELLEGGQLSEAADLYAVAVILYELCSGHHPYSRLTAKQAKCMEQRATLSKPDNLPPHCWPALKNALAFDEQERTTSVAELLACFSLRQSSLLQRLFGRAG
ncbi:MAG: serine/threonine-protein kinase [Halopseudomonas sp.]|uniref:serine/threonine-protein kinase n=1 Tax=Halopseudomonas sp. TaxID=2901191 RepID=UPI0030034675